MTALSRFRSCHGHLDLYTIFSFGIAIFYARSCARCSVLRLGLAANLGAVLPTFSLL